MFNKDDRVKVAFCPINPELNGKLGTLMYKGETETTRYTRNNFGVTETLFTPSQWQARNAYWTIDIDGYGPIAAFATYDVEVGDDIIVAQAPVGWKEVESKVRRVNNVTRDRVYSIANSRGLSVQLTDEHIRPVKKTNVVKGLTKEEIAQAAIDIFDLDELTVDSGMSEFLEKLGIDLTHDADITANTRVTLTLDVEVSYPKGTEIADRVAVGNALAHKIKSLSEPELAKYLLAGFTEIEV